MDTEMMDKLFLEMSQFTKARTHYELTLERKLKALVAAAKPIVQSLEEIGDYADWIDGGDTDRVYYWSEIEPLKKALDGL